jgi:hypothetical protein
MIVILQLANTLIGFELWQKPWFYSEQACSDWGGSSVRQNNPTVCTAFPYLLFSSIPPSTTLLPISGTSDPEKDWIVR